jgi:hypothetical protein
MSSLPVKRLRNDRASRGGSALVVWVVALSVVAPVVAQTVEPNGTPLTIEGTPRPVATPLTQAEDSGGVGSRLVAQQSAAQATIAAYATRAAAQENEIAALRAALSQAQVTATALVGVAANTVLDPDRQSVIIQTDLEGMLRDDEQAVGDARTALIGELARFPFGCRAGFTLIGGNAPSIEQGIALAERVDGILRAFWPTIFTASTGAEHFALPDQEPLGQVTIDIFFYSGCEPVG